MNYKIVYYNLESKPSDAMEDFLTKSMKEQYHSIYKIPEAKQAYYEITELIMMS